MVTARRPSKSRFHGVGITDALRDARNLAAALLAGGDEALVRYWRQRDVDSIDLFHFAKDFGGPGYVNAPNGLVYGRVRSRPDLITRLADSIDRAFSPYEAIPTCQVVAWVVTELPASDLSVIEGSACGPVTATTIGP